ncbi:glycosyltransferase family 4 protein [Thermosulfuriphilus ammonigenes]|uniref:Glycosyltransferase family 4 protein n=1 Tax=Thermosulfuriphilus ammonigenes TaxID=1936021 RepID=A0A6G7PY79_9BACT|nr:glycosyltransferase family 1 protein [Thermosulfuriphilus ammonigenes]MBA2849530.1 glycosyltransferase involved in cell wall biosynthesis [Thermosulfuriphilus ammonigenes]QIJ72363.1 glycosyltransferase family 4 protein [Thermosulfuriphilus ammonigenes]
MIFVNSRFFFQKVTGVQRWALEISYHLSRLDSSLKFITFKQNLDPSRDHLNVLFCGFFRGHLWEQIDLPLFLYRKGNPLLINLCNTAPLLYVNQLVSILDLSFIRNPSWFSKKFVLFYRFLIPKIAKRAKKIITISEFSRQEIVSLLNIPGEKIEVIYCGVSERLKFFSQKDFPNKYGQYILTVSSLNPRKNFGNLILAFNKLKLKNLKLVIVGDFDSRVFSNQVLSDLILGNPNIIRVGYVSDQELSGLYKNALLFVYPSLYEGFGLPPLEAMSCGCPVVVSNIASLLEVCGTAAYYVNPHDINDIARGIYTVLKNKDLRDDLIKKGYDRARLYTWHGSAQKMMRLIREVVNG